MEENQIIFTLASILAFVFGCVVGSFLNVCIYRVPRGESVISPRSRCPKCLSAIAWYDNIPLLSWLLLGARCRTCSQPISWIYPLVEGLTGALYLLVFWRYQFTMATPVYMVLSAALILCAFVDFAEWIIPDEVTLPGIPIGIGMSVVAMFYPGSRLVVLGPFAEAVFNSLLGALAGGLLLFALDKLSLLILKKRGMGGGDVKLLAMLGAFFGLYGAGIIVFIAALTGAIIGIIAIQIVKHRSRENMTEKTHSDATTKPEEAESPSEITSHSSSESLTDDGISLDAHYLPFGPYLCLGGLAVMLFGDQTIQAYTKLIDWVFGPITGI